MTYLFDSTHWEVRDVDLYRFFDALPLLVSSNAIVGLLDGAWSPELREYLDQIVLSMVARRT